MYLNCHSYFSLRFGTISPADLARQAAEQGVQHLALTDSNNTSATYDFLKAARELGLHAIPGIEFRNEQNQLLYIGIARNDAGFLNLNRFLSEHSLWQKALPEVCPPLEHCWVIYPWGREPDRPLMPQEFIGIHPSQVNRLVRSPLRHQLQDLVAWNPVTFASAEDYLLHAVLQAIDQNSLLSRLRQEVLAHPSDYWKPPDTLRQQFKLFPQLLDQAQNLLEQCQCSLDLEKPKTKKTFTGSAAADRALLIKLAEDGFRYRFPQATVHIRERFEKEIEVIDKLGFSAYFLITWDIVRYAQSRGFHHVGRGSGANSLVAYCLQITDVDPIELDLYFERFINPHRTSPPDFDIDFSWDERDEVTDYIFKRYGADHVALLATYTTFKGRSIFRELGKVFGLPKAEIDGLLEDHASFSKYASYGPPSPKGGALQVEVPGKAEPVQRDVIYQRIIHYGQRMANFPNHLSIHAGGVLIAEEPLNQYTALQLMPKGFPIVHFDMYVAEDFGFHKFDVLSQRGLGHIKEAVKIIRQNRQVDVDIHRIQDFKQDERVRQLLGRAHTIGAFYIESPAMRGLLSKLKCQDYVTLVAASSVIRPGVAQSGMMREYIQRHNYPESFEFIHPIFEQHLGETYGVMVYQEDVIKIAHHFAGIDLGQADILRRAMSGKLRNKQQLMDIKANYYKNCRTKGYPEALIDEVWRQIESFSGYSFCKAHSASFAVESFQSLYLKAYYPLEFMTAVINNFGGFYSTEIYLHEARMEGARIEAPCVNNSQWLSRLEGQTLWMGFVHMKDLERGFAQRIMEERQAQGPFCSLTDFVDRLPVHREQLNLLIRIGAFRFTSKSKQALLWEKNGYLRKSSSKTKSQAKLFQLEEQKFALPVLEQDPIEDAYDQMELLGFPLCSPFELIDGPYPQSIRADDLIGYENQSIEMTGYFVTKKNVRTVRKEQMNFGTWLDERGRFFDSTHFPPS